MCLYDLQKAFDSVEYPVLLEKLYDVGVNGKMWRLLKSWYKGDSCQVKVDGRVSDRFMVERGVKQGSVLSPTLFLLIMDPLLRQLQASGLGLSVNQYYAGGYLHADDIRTLATSEESLKQQVALLNAFADRNFLRLNISKCEIVMFSRDQSTAFPSCEVDGSILPAGDVGKCLGYWWKSDLLATKSVEENIWKAHRAFFHSAAITALEMPTIRSRLLVTKLGFLWWVMESSSGSISGRVLEALCDDVESMCLVKECRELEESFGTQHVDAVIRGNSATAREMKETIYWEDR